MTYVDQDAAGVTSTSTKKISADKRALITRLEELKAQGRLRVVRFAPVNEHERLEDKAAALQYLNKKQGDQQALLKELNALTGRNYQMTADGRGIVGQKQSYMSPSTFIDYLARCAYADIRRLDGKHYTEDAIATLENFVSDGGLWQRPALGLKPVLVEAIDHNEVVAWFVDVKDTEHFVARLEHGDCEGEAADAMPFQVVYSTAKQNKLIKERDDDIARTFAKFEIADTGTADDRDVDGSVVTKGREDEQDRLRDRLCALYTHKYRAAPYLRLLDPTTLEPTDVLPVLPKDSTAATTSDWLDRPLAPLDALLGDAVFSTTSKLMLVRAKGIGKTTLAIACGMRASLGLPFLHWRAGRPCNVLLVDADMGRRQLKDRIVSEAKRIGQTPATFFALSHEDLAVAPLHLDTMPAARQAIEDFIEERMGGKVDLIIFDNLASLVEGDLVSGIAWKAMMPWVRSLTERCIGQVWIHHAGHNTKRFYGSDTTSWHIDAVMHLDHVARDNIDVSFALNFDEKARDRTPDNRDQFAKAKVALVNDAWQVDGVAVAVPKKRSQLTTAEAKFFEVLAATGDLVTIEAWIKALITAGLLNAEDRTGHGLGKTTSSSRKLLSRHRKALVAKGWITEDEDGYVAVCPDGEG